MEGLDNMPITRTNEIILKTQILKTTDNLIKSFILVKKSLETQDVKNLSMIFDLDNEIKMRTISSLNTIIVNYQMGPLGKDLRRNISYTFINKYLRDIAQRSIHISTFLIDAEKAGFEVDFLLPMINLMILGLKKTRKVLEFEDQDLGRKLVDFDYKVNKEYRELVKIDFEAQQISNIQIKPEIVDSLKIGYIITSKHFEDIGDKMKDIARCSLYIATGALFNA